MLAIDPNDPMDRIEPAEPIDRSEPAEPIDKIEPADPIDRMEPVDPIDRNDPVASGRTASWEPAPSTAPASAGREGNGVTIGPSSRTGVPVASTHAAIRARRVGSGSRHHPSMRAVATRVTRADVTVDGDVVGVIDRPGLLVLVGVTHTDTAETARALAAKLFHLRILRDEQSCATTGAPLLVVSQFTLYGRTEQRPSPVVERRRTRRRSRDRWSTRSSTALRRCGATVATGVFGAMMQVSSVNDGPFTVLVEVA